MDCQQKERFRRLLASEGSVTVNIVQNYGQHDEKVYTETYDDFEEGVKEIEYLELGADVFF